MDSAGAGIDPHTSGGPDSRVDPAGAGRTSVKAILSSTPYVNRGGRPDNKIGFIRVRGSRGQRGRDGSKICGQRRRYYRVVYWDPNPGRSGGGPPKILALYPLADKASRVIEKFQGWGPVEVEFHFETARTDYKVQYLKSDHTSTVLDGVAVVRMELTVFGVTSVAR